MASAGISDWITLYTDVTGDGTSRMNTAENAQPRMGASLWEHPEFYIRNSPIFYADKVTTPLLMVHNSIYDHNVPFNQGVAFFTALRRLGKPAWMLSYDRGGHGEDGRERQDRLLRTTQFFDHYLKGKPAPAWMTRGIPAAKKGIDTGMQPDPTRDPSNGSLLIALHRKQTT